jgi:DNA-binding CsgD family transcriptional regulator
LAPIRRRIIHKLPRRHDNPQSKTTMNFFTVWCSVLFCLATNLAVRANEPPVYRTETNIVYGAVAGKNLTGQPFWKTPWFWGAVVLAASLLMVGIRDVSTGGSPMSSHIASKVVRHFHLIGISPTESENLSPREREVLDLLACGFIYKEIGDQLKISAETVRTYVKNICQKMHVRSRLEAVAKLKSEAY